MPENSINNQSSLIGLEVTPGVLAAAFKIYDAYGFDIQPDGNIETITPQGFKYPVAAVIGDEWSAIDLVNPVACYRGMLPILSGMFGKVAPVGTTSKTYVWNPSTNAADDIAFYSLQSGNPILVRQSLYAFFNSFSLDIARNAAALTASMMGRPTSNPAGLSAAPVEVGVIPIVPKTVDVWIDPTFLTLGATKLLRAFSTKISIGDKNERVTPLDSSVSGYAATVEAIPKTEVTLDLAADAIGQSYLVNMREGSTLYLRWKAVGPIIAAAVPYSLMFDMALKITSMVAYKAVSGSLLGMGYTCQLAHDAVAGKALQVTLVTDQTL